MKAIFVLNTILHYKAKSPGRGVKICFLIIHSDDMGWSCASLSRHVWQLQTMSDHNQTKTFDSIHCDVFRNIDIFSKQRPSWSIQIHYCHSCRYSHNPLVPLDSDQFPFQYHWEPYLDNSLQLNANSKSTKIEGEFSGTDRKTCSLEKELTCKV